MTTKELNELADSLQSEGDMRQGKYFGEELKEAARRLRLMATMSDDANKLRTALHDIFELASRQKSNRDCAVDEGLIDTALAAVRVIRKVCDERKDDMATYNLKIQEWWWQMKEVTETAAVFKAWDSEAQEDYQFSRSLAYSNGNKALADMESFMREHQIPLEKPK